MRVAILFLIFLNLALFYWAQQQDFSQMVSTDETTIRGVAPIELLSERGRNGVVSSIQQQSNNQTQTTTEQNNSSSRKLVCFSVGPFPESNLSDEVYEILLDSGH